MICILYDGDFTNYRVRFVKAISEFVFFSHGNNFGFSIYTLYIAHSHTHNVI